MLEDDDEIILGTTSHGELAALRRNDRRRHLYLIGKTGTGKSSLLYNLMLADLAEGRGFALSSPVQN